MAQRFYKRLYSPREAYGILVDALRGARHLLRGRRLGLLGGDFVERIMLAVTEVNGCEVCTWAHTRMALEQGLSEGEVDAMLDGRGDQVPQAQRLGVVFAQHYADTRGRPSAEAWRRLQAHYGRETALAILGAVRAIMAGNAHGIPLSALLSRLRGRPVGKTGLAYEVGMVLSVVPMLLVALLHALALEVGGTPVLRGA